jgi:hypothetical protein
VSSEILVAPDGQQFISGDCGCIFVEHSAVASSSFVLPWDVNSFKPTEPDPNYSSPPKPLSAFASITPAIAIHFGFVRQGQGGNGGARTLNISEIDEYNDRFVEVAKDELYGTRTTLSRFVGRF